ncbi:MAG: gliding motility-associated ABC transporter ATP-binding subunit GldA [Lewinellaceae bacterium]|nr:gliding motility-associated ABC transporter ATP-binding subunit GldA [Phaeodactylibacter sp.]MCB9038900.1 gliding motility-associated ABC transporter ATP-binding subunit GldA [Lewinellaceae bacterium]
MSVTVQDLTKIYGAQRAVDRVSFQAKAGEVLGFLGPNGAGKTTTMKMITSFIPPDEGTVAVCGLDVSKQPMEVRRCIGYLPEHNPLYKDMYVREYLGFIARLHQLKNSRRRVEELIDMTGLALEQHKLIGALSKGYRQRVGLAQAMLHDPEVLILDEPTSGLDPNQLADIRRLIKQLGQEKTVIFSTHIMQEVKAICDRVLIINRGKIVANDSIEDLQRRIAAEAVVTVEFQKAPPKKALSAVPQLKELRELGKNRFQLISGPEADLRPAIFDFAVEHQIKLLELHKEVYEIDEVFQKLTQ